MDEDYESWVPPTEEEDALVRLAEEAEAEHFAEFGGPE